MRVLAARPSRAWAPGTDQVRARLQLAQMQTRRDLRDAVKVWDSDPRRVAQDELHNSNEVRRRLETAAAKPSAERWAPLALELDPRLLQQRDWPATAAMLQQAHEQGHDVGAATRALVDEEPLGDRPARDLRYRIVSRLEVGLSTEDAIQTGAARTPAMTRERRETTVRRPPQPGSPRR